MAENLVADLWAIETDGYFESWQGDVVSTSSSLLLSMIVDRSLTAIFQRYPPCTIEDLLVTDMLCSGEDFLHDIVVA